MCVRGFAPFLPPCTRCCSRHCLLYHRALLRKAENRLLAEQNNKGKRCARGRRCMPFLPPFTQQLRAVPRCREKSCLALRGRYCRSAEYRGFVQHEGEVGVSQTAGWVGAGYRGTAGKLGNITKEVVSVVFFFILPRINFFKKHLSVSNQDLVGLGNGGVENCGV